MFGEGNCLTRRTVAAGDGELLAHMGKESEFART